jgi:hypothetical protein
MKTIWSILAAVSLAAFLYMVFGAGAHWVHPFLFCAVGFIVLAVVWNQSPPYHIGHN